MDDVTGAIASLEDRLKQNSQFNTSLSSRMESVTKLALITALSLDEDNVVPALREALSLFWLELRFQSLNYFTAWAEPFTLLMTDAAKIVALSKTVPEAEKGQTSYVYWLCSGEINRFCPWDLIEKESSLQNLGYESNRVYVSKPEHVESGLIDENQNNDIPGIPRLIAAHINKLFSSERFRDILNQWGNQLSDEILATMVNHALENQQVEQTQILSEYCKANSRDIKPGIPYLIAVLRDYENVLQVCSLNPDVSARLTQGSLVTRYKEFEGYSILEFAVRELCEKNDDESLKEGLECIHKYIEQGATPNQLTLRLITGDYKKQIFLSLWNRFCTKKELAPLFTAGFTDFLCGSNQDIRDNIKVINHFISQDIAQKNSIRCFFNKLFATHDTALYKDFFEEWLPKSQRQLLLDVALLTAIEDDEPNVVNLLLDNGAQLGYKWANGGETTLSQCRNKADRLDEICAWVKINPAKFFCAPPSDLEELLYAMINSSKGNKIRNLIGVGVNWKTPRYEEVTKKVTFSVGFRMDFAGYNTECLLIAALRSKNLEIFKALVSSGYPLDANMPEMLRKEATYCFNSDELPKYIDVIKNPVITKVSDKRYSLFGNKNKPTLDTKPSEPLTTNTSTSGAN